MRVLVCGGRDWPTTPTQVIGLCNRLDRLPPDTILVHGACRGADRLAACYAAYRGLTRESYPAQWRTYGKAAGPMRNRQMLATGIDRVLAFHAHIETSKGTADMVRIALRAGVPVEVIAN